MRLRADMEDLSRYLLMRSEGSPCAAKRKGLAGAGPAAAAHSPSFVLSGADVSPAAPPCPSAGPSERRGAGSGIGFGAEGARRARFEALRWAAVGEVRSASFLTVAAGVAVEALALEEEPPPDVFLPSLVSEAPAEAPVDPLPLAVALADSGADGAGFCALPVEALPVEAFPVEALFFVSLPVEVPDAAGADPALADRACPDCAEDCAAEEDFAPDLAVPDFPVRDLVAADFAVPDFSAPAFVVPAFAVPDFAVPDFAVPAFAVSDVDAPDLAAAGVDAALDFAAAEGVPLALRAAAAGAGRSDWTVAPRPWLAPAGRPAPAGGTISRASIAGSAIPWLNVWAMLRPIFIISAWSAAWRLQTARPALNTSRGVTKGVM